jgi:hypothetical protein
MKSAWIRDLLCVALLLSFAATFAYPRWRAGIDWRDEGLLAYGAVRVAGGEVPHRDFVSLQPPLSYYAVAGLFRIEGTSLATLRILGLSVYLLLPLLLYAIARSLGAGSILSFAAAFPICLLGMPYVFFVPLAVWQGIVASLIAVALFIPAVRTGRQWLALSAGIFTAFSLFLRHDQAVYTGIALCALVVALRFASDHPVAKANLGRTIFFWLIGIGVVVIPAFLVWWTIGALGETYRQLVVFPFATYRKTSALPFPRITAGKTPAEIAVVVLYYLPPLVQASVGIYLAQLIVRHRYRFQHAILAFLFIWSALFYLQVIVRSDQTHLLITLPPFFLLSGFAWSVVCRQISNRPARMIFSSALAILIALFLWTVHTILLPDISRATEPLAVARGGVRIEQQRRVTDFVHGLQQYVPPTQSMLALPYQPMFYFLSERRNPTRWNYLWPGDQRAQDFEQFIEEMKHDPPAVILLSEEREFGKYAAPISKYIDRQYVREKRFGNLVIYIRPSE